MTTLPPFESGAFPRAASHDDPHGAKPAARFEPKLEAEYVRSRLLNTRSLIRMACLLGLLVTSLRIAEMSVAGVGVPGVRTGVIVLFPLVALTASALLTWFAWRPSFEHRYLPLANVLVPVRNIVAAVAIAGMSAIGQTELLMLLPVMVLSPFFFLGLHFRPALVCVVLTIVAFGSAAAVLGLPTPVLLRACGFLVVTAAASAVAAWQLERQSRASFLDGRLIAQLAEQDALTGAKNRRVFDAHLLQLWQQAIAAGERLSILLIDVDHFKAYNDRYGHQAGDLALRRVATAVQAQIGQPTDVLARYGGEEFAAILSGTDGPRAHEVAEMMRRAVSALAIEHDASRGAGVVTVSIGIAAIQPTAGREPRGALQLADEALYTAKVNGRNRVHLAEESDYLALQTGVFAQAPDCA